MDYQLVFNIAFGIIGTLGGWFFKTVYDQIKSLEDDLGDLESAHESDHREVVQKINDLALSLPDKYVNKGDFDNFAKIMNHRFDKLEEKIDALKK
jgi:hypothetical protein